MDASRADAQGHQCGRKIESFGTSFHAFVTLGKSYETVLEVAGERLSKRYAMDFREPARRYGVLGTPADAAEKILELIGAGVRDISVDVICHPRDRDAARATRQGSDPAGANQ